MVRLLKLNGIATIVIVMTNAENKVRDEYGSFRKGIGYADKGFSLVIVAKKLSGEE